MTAAIATLILGFILGYLGQRSRLCFIAGYRDFLLTRDTFLLKGIGGAFIGALIGFALFKILGGSVPGFPLLQQTPAMTLKGTWIVAILGGLGVGLVGALSGGCPFRMHVLAAEGRKSYWYYLLGFYVGLIFYNVVTIHFQELLRSIK